MKTLILDTGNLYYCVGRHYPQHKIDYKKIILEYSPLDKLIAFVSDVQTEDFVDYLEDLGFMVILKRPQRYKVNGNYIWRTNWLIEFAYYTLAALDTDFVDTVVIGSNNLDLIPLIQRVDGIELLGCGISKRLQRLCPCHEITPDLLFTDIESKCLYD